MTKELDARLPTASELEQLAFARFAEARPPIADEIGREDLVRLACRIYDTRRARARFFTNSLLGEPVWDMLLALYCLPSRGQKLSVSGLCHAADVPTTTALRWVQLIEQKGLIERRRDPCDGRRFHLHLTAHGEQLMSGYLTSICDKVAAR